MERTYFEEKEFDKIDAKIAPLKEGDDYEECFFSNCDFSNAVSFRIFFF